MKYATTLPGLLAVVFLFLLSACGQKGPLFLPGNPDEIRSDVPATTTGDEENEDDDQQRP